MPDAALDAAHDAPSQSISSESFAGTQNWFGIRYVILYKGAASY